MQNIGYHNELLCITVLAWFPSLNLVPSGAGARWYLSESLHHHQTWSVGTGLSSNSPSPHLEAGVGGMVAMVVARQLKWLYNQLKVLTVSRILYILINLSSNRPWSKARSNDSSRWCLIFPFSSSPLGLAFLHAFVAAVQSEKSPSIISGCGNFLSCILWFGPCSTQNVWSCNHSLTSWPARSWTGFFAWPDVGAALVMSAGNKGSLCGRLLLTGCASPLARPFPVGGGGWKQYVGSHTVSQQLGIQSCQAVAHC